jgi:hypothetical protein
MPNKKEDIYRRAYDQLCAYMDEHKLRHTPERFNILSSVCTLQRFTIDFTILYAHLPALSMGNLNFTKKLILLILLLDNKCNRDLLRIFEFIIDEYTVRLSY